MGGNGWLALWDSALGCCENVISFLWLLMMDVPWLHSTAAHNVCSMAAHDRCSMAAHDRCSMAAHDGCSTAAHDGWEDCSKG